MKMGQQESLLASKTYCPLRQIGTFVDSVLMAVLVWQVLEIQLAVKARVKSFFFEGSELPLRPSCNVFITMNPGYAGRSELPDNLKVGNTSVMRLLCHAGELQPQA